MGEPGPVLSEEAFKERLVARRPARRSTPRSAAARVASSRPSRRRTFRRSRATSVPAVPRYRWSSSTRRWKRFDGSCWSQRTRPIEERVVALSQQHHVEHRVVGDQDVRRRGLHVPAGAHLRAIDRLDEVAPPPIPWERVAVVEFDRTSEPALGLARNDRSSRVRDGLPAFRRPGSVRCSGRSRTDARPGGCRASPAVPRRPGPGEDGRAGLRRGRSSGRARGPARLPCVPHRDFAEGRRDRCLPTTALGS